jgi:putative component of toxin-antitoxin plasmid stabilization module
VKAISVGDVSGDGIADLMVVGGDGYLYYYPNNAATNAGHAPFTSAAWRSPTATWGGVKAISVGDVSGDGIADLMVVGGDGYLYYYPNNAATNAGHAPFASAAWRSPTATWGTTSSISASDVSGDGVADLMVVGGDGYLSYYPNNAATNAGHAPFASAAWRSPTATWANNRLG